MTSSPLRAILGEPPVPQGSWERDPVYVSMVALKAGPRMRERAAELAARLRALHGVSSVDVRPNGALVIAVSVPGEIVEEILEEAEKGETGPADAKSSAIWPDFPRTWDNPGFSVRYAHVRALAVRRWARQLGFSDLYRFRPELLTDSRDRRVLRLLAEWPSRRRAGDSGLPAYLERLATAYHDAHEWAPAIPKGEEKPGEIHIARLAMARAVQIILSRGLISLGEIPPSFI